MLHKKTEKVRKRIPLSKYYGELIEGIQIEELVERGFLVPDVNYAVPIAGLDGLKTDQKGEFTSKSEKEVFNKKANYQSVLDNYLLYAKGKRTIIFNSNTEANAALVELFQEKGVNARGFDSVNNTGGRKELIKWFKETPDAVLHNVGVFTTGFDCKEIEAVILNRATTSLSLYLQMVGRGGRITDKIYKPTFTVVDLGGNIDRFDTWSSPKDWALHFYNETEKIIRPSDLAPLKNCVHCEAFIPRSENVCPECGKEQVKESGKSGVYVTAEPVNKMPPPNGAQIVNYCKRTGGEVKDARDLLSNYLRDMVINAGTPSEVIEEKAENGELYQRLKKVITPIYFTIQGSDLQGNRVRTLNYYVNHAQKKIVTYFVN